MAQSYSWSPGFQLEPYISMFHTDAESFRTLIFMCVNVWKQRMLHKRGSNVLWSCALLRESWFIQCVTSVCSYGSAHLVPYDDLWLVTQLNWATLLPSIPDCPYREWEWGFTAVRWFLDFWPKSASWLAQLRTSPCWFYFTVPDTVLSVWFLLKLIGVHFYSLQQRALTGWCRSAKLTDVFHWLEKWLVLIWIHLLVFLKTFFTAFHSASIQSSF